VQLGGGDCFVPDFPPVALQMIGSSPALRLNNTAHAVRQADVESLRTYGYSDGEILETIAMIGIARWASAIAFGVRAVPDFENPRVSFRNPQISEEEVDIFA